jgi:hypothetical protein
MKRQPSMLGALYVCERCDSADPMDAAAPWLKGELGHPEPVADTLKQTDLRRLQ